VLSTSSEIPKRPLEDRSPPEMLILRFSRHPEERFFVFMSQEIDAKYVYASRPIICGPSPVIHFA